jgi:uncharacterized membrane-anchored protein YhcB (DUF1043 family)
MVAAIGETLVILAWVVVWVGVVIGVNMLIEWIDKRLDSRRERIERELDEAQAQLRATILQLATELRIDGHEARKAMIRASFDASQRAGNAREPREK